MLSGGRFALGVGTGWDPAEFAALGLDVRQRGARTDEALAVLRALWNGAPVDFEGRFTTLAKAVPATAPRAKEGRTSGSAGRVTPRCAGRSGSVTAGTAG